MKIPALNLEPWNPFNNTVWVGLDDPITREEVSQALKEGRLREQPVPLWSYRDPPPTREEHIERVAYLSTLEEWDPLSLDVGIPSMGFYVDWIVQDGNHRLAAQFFKGIPVIQANVSGSTAYARELLLRDPRASEEQSNKQG